VGDVPIPSAPHNVKLGNQGDPEKHPPVGHPLYTYHFPHIHTFSSHKGRF
jgi:hypothetical protein